MGRKEIKEAEGSRGGKASHWGGDFDKKLRAIQRLGAEYSRRGSSNHEGLKVGTLGACSIRSDSCGPIARGPTLRGHRPRGTQDLCPALQGAGPRRSGLSEGSSALRAGVLGNGQQRRRKMWRLVVGRGWGERASRGRGEFGRRAWCLRDPGRLPRPEPILRAMPGQEPKAPRG